MDPINYSTQVATPFQSAMQGYQFGAAVRDDQAQQADLIAKKEQQAAAQLQMQRDMGALINNPNTGPAEFAAMTLKYPAFKDQFKQANEMRSADQKASSLSHGVQVYAALANGKPEIAKELLTQRAKALRNGGNERDAKAAEAMEQMIGVSSDMARNMIGLSLSAMDDKFPSMVTSLGKEGREAALAPAELAIKTAEAKIKGVDAAAAPAKVTADINKTVAETDNLAKRLGLDRDKLTSEVQIELEKLKQKNGELPEFVAKDINEATTSAIASAQSAEKLTTLAADIDKFSGQMGTGWKGSLDELTKAGFLNKNEVTRIRAEFNRIVTPAAMAAYKKVAAGSTSDKDIETAMIGVPKDNADAATLASFLRGAAKLQIYDSVLSNAKSEWLGAVRNLGKTKADIEIDGVRVPAGATFKTFIEEYVPRKVGEKTSVSTIMASPYAEFAAPVVPAAPVAPMVPGGN